MPRLDLLAEDDVDPTYVLCLYDGKDLLVKGFKLLLRKLRSIQLDDCLVALRGDVKLWISYWADIVQVNFQRVNLWCM